MVILSPGKYHLSEKQLVIHVGRAVENMPGIVRGDERRGQAGARKDESTAEKAKNSWSYRNRWFASVALMSTIWGTHTIVWDNHTL